MNNNDTVLRCQNVCKTFDDGATRVKVLEHVDLIVPAGEMLAIVGSSGAGKSTLLHILGGLDSPDEGDIWVAQEQLSTLNDKAKSRLRNRYLGFVYQFHHLLPEFNALENVCMPLLIRGSSPKLARQTAQAFLEQVGLQDRQTHRIGQLSGGERQRVAIARALVTEPRCVFADEPTGNLDQHTAEKVFELMLDLNKKLNTSFVIVTHNRSLASQMHRTLILEQGNLRIAF